MTVMPGRAVTLPLAGGAVCEVALPVSPSSSDAELESRSVLLAVLLAKSAIVAILIGAARFAVASGVGKLPASPWAGRFQTARRSSLKAGRWSGVHSNDVRRQEDREAEKRRRRSSGGRIRCRRSDARACRERSEAAVRGVSRTAPCLPAR